MKISKVLVAAFLGCILVATMFAWLATSSTVAKTRISGFFDAAAIAVLAAFLGWMLVDDLRLQARQQKDEAEGLRYIETRRGVEANIPDPAPCPWCGYGPVSASKGGYCFDCQQYVLPGDMEQTVVKVVETPRFPPEEGDPGYDEWILYATGQLG